MTGAVQSDRKNKAWERVYATITRFFWSWEVQWLTCRTEDGNPLNLLSLFSSHFLEYSRPLSSHLCVYSDTLRLAPWNPSSWLVISVCDMYEVCAHVQLRVSLWVFQCVLDRTDGQSEAYWRRLACFPLLYPMQAFAAEGSIGHQRHSAEPPLLPLAVRMTGLHGNLSRRHSTQPTAELISTANWLHSFCNAWIIVSLSKKIWWISQKNGFSYYIPFILRYFFCAVKGSFDKTCLYNGTGLWSVCNHSCTKTPNEYIEKATRWSDKTQCSIHCLIICHINDHTCYSAVSLLYFWSVSVCCTPFSVFFNGSLLLPILDLSRNVVL